MCTPEHLIGGQPCLGKPATRQVHSAHPRILGDPEHYIADLKGQTQIDHPAQGLVSVHAEQRRQHQTHRRAHAVCVAQQLRIVGHPHLAQIRLHPVEQVIGAVEWKPAAGGAGTKGGDERSRGSLPMQLRAPEV